MQGTALWYSTDLIACYLTAVQLRADEEGWTTWTFAEDKGERALAGGIVNALPTLQSCTRLQSAAGAGKRADYQNLGRSF